MVKGSHFSNADFEGPSYGIEYELGLGLVKTSIPLEKIKMNTDFITEEHSEWFEELINSPEVYIIKGWESPRHITNTNTFDSLNTYATPVTLTTKSFTKKTVANDKLIQYTFEVEKSKTLNTQSI